VNTLLKGKKIVLMGVVNKSSIAWGCALALKKCGAEVIYTYQNDRVKKQLDRLIDENDATVECDVAADDNIEKAFIEIKERFGNIDGVIHSIAFAPKEALEGDITDAPRESFSIAHEISSFSLIAVAREARKILNPGGSIATLTYIGSSRAVSNYNIMGLAKASLEASVRYLAHDLAEQDIRVNAVSSGAIKTLASSGIKGFRELLDDAATRTPAGKQVTIEEVGNTVAFLMSDLSTGITGDLIYVDKGTHLS
jgi:enoyl-[acyl-carrier protein] reductase I